jgi:uncharacterized protein (DUF362 family)
VKLTSCTVALASCRSYDPGELKTKVDKLFRAAGFSVRYGHKVLLKPNLVAATRDGLAVTHPQVVRMMAEWCLDHGAVVSVGDSPAFGNSASVMEQCGLTKALSGLPVRIATFDRHRIVSTASQLSVSVATEVFQHDLLINLPKLKAHGQMRVSMAVKNCFGVVVAWRKAMAHMHYGDDGRFVRLLADLLDLLPDGVSMIDGIMAMHRTGPLNGVPLPLGVLGASINPVALDTAMLAVIGLSPELSPLWRECTRRGLSGCSLMELAFPLARPAELATTDFVFPEDLQPIRFQLWRFFRNSIKKMFKT